MISITIFFAHAQLQNSVKKSLKLKQEHNSDIKREIGGVSTNCLLDVWETLLSFSKYIVFSILSQNINYCSVAFSLLFSI